MNKKLSVIIVKAGIRPDSPEAQDIVKRVKEVVADVKTIIKHGKINFTDTLKAVYDVAELVVHIIVEDKKIPKEEIEPLVKELAHYVYFDPEALGDPNISFLPEWCEEGVEHELIDTFIPFVAEILVRSIK